MGRHSRLKRERIWTDDEIAIIEARVMAHAEELYANRIEAYLKQEGRTELTEFENNLFRAHWFLDGYTKHIQKLMDEARIREGITPEQEAKIKRENRRNLELEADSRR